MTSASSPSRIPRLTPRTSQESSPSASATPSPAAAPSPSKPSPRIPQKKSTTSSKPTTTSPSRPRSSTHSSPASSLVKPSPPPPRPPSATSISPLRQRSATTTSSRPTTASTAALRPPTSSSTPRVRSTSSSATPPATTPRSRATSSATTSPRVSSTPSNQPTARPRSTSKPSSATPTRSRAPSNPTAVKPSPSAPPSAKPVGLITARTVAATAAAVAPAPVEAPSAIPEVAKPAPEPPASTQLPPADLPTPTDPSVPIYHAPHFTAATHILPSSSPAPPCQTTSSSTPTPPSSTPAPSPPITSRLRTSLTQQAPFHRSRTSSLIDLESKVNEWREAYLHLSIEEVSDWLTRTNHNQPLNHYLPTQPRRDALDKESEDSDRRHSLTLSGLLPPPPLFDCLQSGVLLCELALAIQPDLHLPYKPKAQVGTFLARDNIDGFIRAALGWGVPRSQLFEVDDLVMRKNDRGVVNSLMDITRVVYLSFGIAPPTLVQMELEIAQIEQQTTTAPAPPRPPPPPAEPAPVVEVAEEEQKPKGPRYLPYIADPNDPLDVAVGGLVNGYHLDLLMRRVERGQYYIGEEKVHHLRLVRHLVLVRVGGGWEPLVPMASRKIQELKE